MIFWLKLVVYSIPGAIHCQKHKIPIYRSKGKFSYIQCSRDLVSIFRFLYRSFHLIDTFAVFFFCPELQYKLLWKQTSLFQGYLCRYNTAGYSNILHCWLHHIFVSKLLRFDPYRETTFDRHIDLCHISLSLFFKCRQHRPKTICFAAVHTCFFFL